MDDPDNSLAVPHFRGHPGQGVFAVEEKRLIQDRSGVIREEGRNHDIGLYQILEEVIRNGLEKITEIEQSSKPFQEKLALILRIHTRGAVDFNKMKLLVHEQRSLSPEHREELKERQRLYVGRLIKVLEELRDRGEMLDLDLAVCAYAFFGMVSWAYRWYRPEGKVKLDELSESFYTIFTRGIYRERPAETHQAVKKPKKH